MDEFGRSVKRARTLNGWGHKDLAAQINPAPGRSFLCDIEKGKRDIGPVTVGKLIKALDLDPNWIDRFLDADVSPDAEETKLDRDAERLMRLAAQDETAPETAEDLLISLAQEYALGFHPRVHDELVAGGLSRVRSSNVFMNLDGSPTYQLVSQPPGFVSVVNTVTKGTPRLAHSSSAAGTIAAGSRMPT